MPTSLWSADRPTSTPCRARDRVAAKEAASKPNHLIDGEAERARQWAKELAESLVANP